MYRRKNRGTININLNIHIRKLLRSCAKCEVSLYLHILIGIRMGSTLIQPTEGMGAINLAELRKETHQAVDVSR
jgi:hypothetical protein